MWKDLPDFQDLDRLQELNDQLDLALNADDKDKIETWLYKIWYIVDIAIETLEEEKDQTNGQP